MIKFTKMHGLGNDFVCIYCSASNFEIKNISSLAKFICDRHFGIGGDGLILICESDVADFKMIIFNNDGTEAEMCGNGIRCVGKFVYDKGLTFNQGISIETKAGIKVLQLHVENEKVRSVTVDMGEPVLQSEKIPVIIDSNIEGGINLRANDREFIVNCVSMGNPHAVTQIDDLENFNINKYGPILENDKHFPKKTNVEFIKVLDRKHVKMRVWERGVGETLACGTGACAVAVTCILNDLTDRKLMVELLGGNLEIEWSKEDNHVYMTGPAEIIFEGVIDYDNN